MRLTRRALNRTLLDRQLLLERRDLAPLAAIELLVGMQAQQARPPFIGLWSRLTRFQPNDLRALIQERQVLRATMLRCTLHLMSRRDFLAFRPLLHPALIRAAGSAIGPLRGSPDLPALVEEGRRILHERPRSFAEVRSLVRERFPEADEHAVGIALRVHLPLVVVPREREWAYRADSHFAHAEEWLGEPFPPAADPAELLARYLAAFGPASLRDAAAWSGVPVSTFRSALRLSEWVTYADEEGAELWDVPSAPFADEAATAPPRLVADFDNLLLSHADRRRVISDEHRRAVITKNGIVLPTILVDGFVSGTWSLQRQGDTAAVVISPFAALPPATHEELAAEAESLAQCLYPDAKLELTFEG